MNSISNGSENLRSIVQCKRVAVGAPWLASFALTYTFPLLNARLGSSGVFYPYALVCAAGSLFILLHLRETKGHSLEELRHLPRRFGFCVVRYLDTRHVDEYLHHARSDL